MKNMMYEVTIHAAALWSMLLQMNGWTKWEVRDGSKVWRKLMDKAFSLSRSL